MRTAILIPCCNEGSTIGKVTKDFQAALPEAIVYVYDNNSTDLTVENATKAGAVVRRHREQGKGNVVRRMFADVDADIYVLVDGDDTYDASSSRDLIRLLREERLDFVNAARFSTDDHAYRPGHRFGNRAISTLVQLVFGSEFADILSGYKVFSRRFVKSFPGRSTGFEIETELAVHALEVGMPYEERSVQYRERPTGSVSKLHTVRDGFRILLFIARLMKDERPLQFFLLAGVILAAVGIGLGLPVVATYLETGTVPRLPTAVLSLGLVLLASLCAVTGLILDVVTKTRREMKRLAYLSIPSISEH